MFKLIFKIFKIIIVLCFIYIMLESFTLKNTVDNAEYYYEEHGILPIYISYIK